MTSFTMVNRSPDGAPSQGRSGWAHDFRFGWRILRKHPMFTLASALTLALGIGANTAIFSVVYGLLMRPLPYPQPQNIVQLCTVLKGESDEMTVTSEELQLLRDQRPPLQALGAYTPVGYNAAMSGEPERVNGLHISHDYLDVLGVRPIFGRAILPDEDKGDGSRVVMIGHGLWQRLAGGDPGIVGKTLHLDGLPYTVIGVLPPNFERLSMPFTHGNNEVWLPIALVSRTVGAGQNLGVLGRIPPDLSLSQARARMQQVASAFHARFPDDLPPQVALELTSYQAHLGEGLRAMLFVLFGASGFVLLIACANVASLLLSRAEGRRREVAIRMAIGAERSDLLRQFMAESLLLSLLGTAAGLLLASGCLKVLLVLSPSELPRLQDVHLDGWALAFSSLVGALAALGFGLVPAIRVLNTDLRGALQEHQGTGGKASMRARRAVVVVQIALSLILLTGSAILLQSFRNLLRQDSGLRIEGVTARSLWLNSPAMGSTASQAQAYAAALDQLRARNIGDAAAIVAAGLPVERGGNISVKAIRQPEGLNAAFRMITPEYFRTLGIPLARGRAFSDLDTGGAQPVAIVNETFARRLFNGDNPLGHSIQVGTGEPPREIVGVVGDVRSQMDRPAPASVMIPIAQAQPDVLKLFGTWFPVQLIIHGRTWGPAEVRAVEQAIHGFGVPITLGPTRTLDQILAASLAKRRFQMVLLTSFALLALSLGMIGIYGVMDEIVSVRMWEIGIRKAIGASSGSILQMVLGASLRLIALGIVMGLVGAFALTRLLQSYLFGLRATDPITFAVMTLGLLTAALGACLIPALRASRMDPMSVLRRS